MVKKKNVLVMFSMEYKPVTRDRMTGNQEHSMATWQTRIGNSYLNSRQDGCERADSRSYMEFHMSFHNCCTVKGNIPL